MSTCALLTWKNPIETAKVFGSIVVSLIVLKYVNLINLFFRFAWVALLASAAAEYSGKLVAGNGFVSKYRPAYKSYAKHFNQVVLPDLAKFNEVFETEVQKIVFSADVETTLKAGGISYILYKITSWFTLYTILFTSVVLAFTVPAIYENFKVEIDNFVAHFSKVVREKSSEYSVVAQEKLAPILKDLEKKLGPVGSFISSKIPVRTASTTVGESPVKSSAASVHESLAPSVASIKSEVPSVPAVPSVPHSTTASIIDEPTIGSTTSSTKFPEVPSSIQQSVHEVIEPTVAEAHPSVSEIVEEAKSHASTTPSLHQI